MGQLGLKLLLMAIKQGKPHDVVRWAVVDYSTPQISQLAPKAALAAL